MTAHSAVLCALLFCVPPPPTDGVALCPPSVPSTAPATEFPEPPSGRMTPPAADAKAPGADSGTGLLGPLADCVTARENEALGSEAPGKDDAEDREGVAPGEDMGPPATAPTGSGGEGGGTEKPSPERDEDTEKAEMVEAPESPEPEESTSVASETETETETEPEAEPTPEPSSAPEPGPAEEDDAASTADTLSPSPSASPSSEPRPTENGTVSRASDPARPTTPADDPRGLDERPPSKKVEELPRAAPVDGLAFEEASATSAFGRAVGVTSTTLLFLLAAGTLGLRLAVGWPRFPPLYLGRRRLSGDLDTH